MADRLDRVNQALAKENSRLKTQFKTQEDDREFLIRQLVAMKKDNARLRHEYEKLKSNPVLNSAQSADDLGSTGIASLPRVPSASHIERNSSSYSHHGSHHANQAEADNRYKEIIKRLKRLLEVERRNLRQVRTQFANDLQNRTELELFLKQCIEDVRHEIAANRENAVGAEVSIDNVNMDDFSPQDRERVMELLLSQERVISLLYSKTFPMQHNQEMPIESSTT